MESTLLNFSDPSENPPICGFHGPSRVGCFGTLLKWLEENWRGVRWPQNVGTKTTFLQYI